MGVALQNPVGNNPSITAREAVGNGLFPVCGMRTSHGPLISPDAPTVSWADLAVAAVQSGVSGDADAKQRRIEALWAPNTVAFLSVVTALDALLQVHAFSPGTEFIMPAVTIPHVVEVLAHHRIFGVPTDPGGDTLAIDAVAVKRAITRRTRGILVGHPRGALLQLDEIAALARDHALLLIEDCSQTHDDSGYRGHPHADVTMFSFGAISGETALGGALLRCDDAALATHLRQHQGSYPRESASVFRERIAAVAADKTVAIRSVFNAWVAVRRWLGVDHAATLGTAPRGVEDGDMFTKLRQRPSLPQLRVLNRRLRALGDGVA